MISDVFPALASVIGEPLFLLRPSGQILDANAAGWAMLELAGEARAGAGLAGFAVEPDAFLAFLRECAEGSRNLGAAVLLRSASGRRHACRAHGVRVDAAAGDGPLLLLRCEADRDAADDPKAEIRAPVAVRADLDRALHEKEELLREMRHRSRNNLQVLLSMFGLALRDETDGRVREQLLKMRGRVLSMSIVQRQARPAGTVVVVDAAALVGELCAELHRAYPAGDVELRLDVAPVTVPVDAAGPLGLIVCELVSNALCHAFAQGGGAQPGNICVTLSRDAEGEIELAVADDGRGLPQLSSGRPTSGLNLARGLAGQLGGTLLVERGTASGRGTRCRLRFPG